MTATVGVLALILSLALPFVVKPLLVKLGVMDVPNERSSHEKPVLRGLGLAVLIAIVAAEAVAVVNVFATYPVGFSWKMLLVILLGTLAAGLLGLGEDLKGVSVPVRSALLLVIAASTSVALIWIVRGSFGTGPHFGWIASPGMPDSVPWVSLIPAWVLVPLAVYGVLFISSYINVANFMDGLNGISGLHGVIAGLAFAAAGYFWMGGGWLTIAGLVLAAGFAGFLPWNLTKPGAFLGDVGSYLLGGAVAVTSFAAFVAGVPVLAAIGPTIIYFGDVGTTLVKRVRAGHKWDEPHKEHAYQRLQQLGISHVAASSINAAFTLAASLLGLVSIFVAPIWWLVLLVGGLALVVLYQLLPRLLAQKFAA
ncbi:UDP-phosphate alpha-N-acetyl-D-fucosaminephosphotransferase [Leucobacter aridicollis]|uniref:UDP-phosphate alpha-N-acetyl-D-fucosaminephosphotransferase n=1 Tax=Leucobacter aridicollis TaxID=283878 RepID=UPI00216A9A45|nr:UDP-phosphate alpha-N-acetyl-D-fucosaminephosphotransferase [Leucobacter aridicollis]MCS3427541.1 UDP-N-acetylmuramyl pentapeptide phosphotransferase/UDP-N-acetylglucosamine-1-phosphate transferase [Leucobacter aridicollis]